MNKDFQEILMLKTLDDMTFDEIAQVTGTNENTAKTTYYRGVEELKSMLSENKAALVASVIGGGALKTALTNNLLGGTTMVATGNTAFMATISNFASTTVGKAVIVTTVAGVVGTTSIAGIVVYNITNNDEPVVEEQQDNISEEQNEEEAIEETPTPEVTNTPALTATPVPPTATPVPPTPTTAPPTPTPRYTYQTFTVNTSLHQLSIPYVSNMGPVSGNERPDLTQFQPTDEGYGYFVSSTTNTTSSTYYFSFTMSDSLGEGGGIAPLESYTVSTRDGKSMTIDIYGPTGPVPGYYSSVSWYSGTYYAKYRIQTADSDSIADLKEVNNYIVSNSSFSFKY